MLYVAQFRELARDNNAVVVPFPAEPPVNEQVIDFSGGAANVAITPGTRFVRLFAAEACHFIVSTDENAEAATTNRPLAANQTEWVSVPTEINDQTVYISAVAVAAP